jgi:hypothetical protein
MALYPLCQHGREPPEAITHAAEAIERKLTNAGERADGLFLLELFAGLAYPTLDVDEVIGREKMKESRFAREMLQEGRQEGKVENAREYILDLLKARFGSKASARLAGAVNALGDIRTLNKLHRLAGTCASLDEFQAALPQGQAAT